MKRAFRKTLIILLTLSLFITGCKNENTDNMNNSDNGAESDVIYDSDYPPISEGEWKQNEFYSATISFAKSKEDLQAHKEAGYNLMMFTTDVTRDVNIETAKLCDELGLYYIMSDRAAISLHKLINFNENSVRSAVYEYKDLKNIIGWDVWDEPGQVNNEWDKNYNNSVYISKAKRMIDYLDKYDPNSVKFINFLPSSNYRKYAEEFIKNSGQSVVSFDNYPFGEDSPLVDGDNWWIDLGFYRKLSHKYNKPFWCWYEQCMADGFKPCDSEIRVLMNSALAYDVKCLIAWMSDIYSDGQKTDTFEEAKLRNQEIMALGTYLFDKKSVNVYHTGLRKKYIDDYYIDKLESSDLIESASDDLVLSVFEDSKTNNKYLFAVNKNYKSKNIGSIELKDEKEIALFDTADSKEKPIGSSKIISFNIPAGSAALYILK